MLTVDLSGCDSPLKIERRLSTFDKRYVRDLWANRGERASAFRRTGHLNLEVVHASKSESVEIHGETQVTVLRGSGRVTDRCPAARAAFDVLQGSVSHAIAAVRNARLVAEGEPTQQLPAVTPAQLVVAQVLAPEYVGPPRAKARKAALV